MSQARVLFSTGSLYPMDTDYCFEIAQEAGCDGVEIMCDSRWTTRDPIRLSQLAARYQQPVKVLHTPMLHLGRELMGWPRMNLIAALECTVEMAEKIGAEAVVLHLPLKISVISLDIEGKRQLLPGPSWRNEGKALRGWIADTLPAYQQKTSVKIAVENLPLHQIFRRKLNIAFWNTVDEWARVGPHLTMDTTHWATHGVDPMTAYNAGKGRISHVHLSNFNGREHRLPHQGDLDLGRLLRQMAVDEFDGTITIELHPDALGFPDDQAIRRNLRESVAFCRQHLGQA